MTKETTQFNRKTALELSQRWASNMFASHMESGMSNPKLDQAAKFMREQREDFFSWLEQVNTDDSGDITVNQVNYLTSLSDQLGRDSIPIHGPVIQVWDLNQKGANKLIDYLKDQLPEDTVTQKGISKAVNQKIELDVDSSED